MTTITCPHEGEVCDRARYCHEPGCTYGLIMSGYWDDDNYTCFAHMNITEKEMEYSEEVLGGELYGSDWSVCDVCDECEDDCPCPTMTEARAKCNDVGQAVPDPWDMEQQWSKEYRVVVPVYGSDAPAVYGIEACGWMHARSLFFTNANGWEGFEGIGYWLISGPAEVPYTGPELPPFTAHPDWKGRHMFHKAIMLDIGLNS